MSLSTQQGDAESKLSSSGRLDDPRSTELELHRNLNAQRPKVASNIRSKVHRTEHLIPLMERSMAPQNDVNDLDLDDLNDPTTDSSDIDFNDPATEGADESDAQVDNDPDAPDVSNHDAPEQPDGELNDPEDGSDNPADEDDTQFNIPGQIPQGENSQDSDQDTFLHQALLYQVRALNELSAAVAALDTNYAGVAGQLRSFLQGYIGQIETVWQNGQINQSSADSVESDPSKQGRFQY